ncbi:MAG: TolC family protein [Bdellovibrionales bacterium]|nr:TolC family protein [Ramlibacter sp.]
MVPAWSQGTLSLDQAILIATDRSRQLVATEASAVASRHMAEAALQLPDPVLKFGVDNFPVTGPDRFSLSRDFMTMRRIGLMQELPTEQKRQLRAQKFSWDALRAQAERQQALALVQRQTALAWLDTYYAAATRELVQQQFQETGLQVQAADAAYRAARGTQAEVFAARSAVAMLQDRLVQTDRQARNATLMLARWVGPDASRKLQGVPPWRDTYLDKSLTLDHLRTHPDVAVLQAQVLAAEGEARLAEANKRPDWTVEASYSQRGSAFSNMVSIGVSVPLQLDQARRQDQEVAARQALVNEAQARYDDMLQSHEAEVRVMLNDWRTGKDRVARYADELIPLAAQRTQAVQLAYRTGKSDLASALAARRDELDMRLQALAVEMETARAWAQLNYLSAVHGGGAGHQE